VSRKRHNVDAAATELACYYDKRSYITHTAKQFLFGRDKANLRVRCLLRDHFRCTECGKENDAENLDMHHILPLGKGGDDKLENVTTLCKWGDCHKAKHVRPMFGRQMAETERSE
jgi:5-methylcytosine-specific restriction endonuclease McrA